MNSNFQLEEILSKYEPEVIKNIDKQNFRKIVSFLKEKGCDYVDEILEDYLDLFCFEYNEFVKKYNKLQEKYNNNLLNEVKEDMNILEEFYM